MRTLKQSLDFIESRLGLSDGDLADASNALLLSDIKWGLNTMQEVCNRHVNFRFNTRKTGKFAVVAVVDTGTVSLINKSKTVTFSSAILNADFKDRIFLSDDNSDLEYRFASITNTTVAKLDVAYIGDTNTVSTFKILKDRYYLGREAAGIWPTMVDRSNEDKIYLRSKNQMSNPYIFDQDTTDTPEDGVILLSLETLFNTGTVGVALASNKITHSASGFIEEFDGLAVRIAGSNIDYTFNYVDADEGTLDRLYTEATAVAASFEIAPPGQLIVELYEKPDTAILIDYEMLRRLPYLVSDNDISLITILDDNVWTKGLLWVMRDNEEDGDPSTALTAEQLFLAALDNAGQTGARMHEGGALRYRDL